MCTNEEWIPISALNHFLYCKRRCALVHLERVWEENRFTTEGRLLHEKVDSGKVEVRGDLKQATGILLHSQSLGVNGKADLVEFHRKGTTWHPFPVEYKRGKGASQEGDSVQLCLQALCLEEMLNISIPEGALFYGKMRRRKQVVFSPELRSHTKAMVTAVHELLRQDRLPPPVNDKRCVHCSLMEQCRPQESANPVQAARYLEGLREKS